MNNKTTMDPRSERMLELLAEGASARVIAKKLGYSEGTMRVYLHNLYRAIGVRNKTEAVIWQLHRKAPAAGAALPQPAPMPVAPPSVPAGNRAGDMALADDLYTALGAMGTFVGPYGQLWEAGLRLKGTPMDEALLAQRLQSRLIWRALLKGDFSYGKLLHDEGHAEHIAARSATDGAAVACLLSLGGYSAAAGQLNSSMGDKRKGSASLTTREIALMHAVAEAVSGKGDESLAPLHQLASEKSRAPALKHLAMAALFHAYRMRKLLEEARQTADALWGEAETTRQQLEAMGVRALTRETTLPAIGDARDASSSTARKTALAR